MYQVNKDEQKQGIFLKMVPLTSSFHLGGIEGKSYSDPPLNQTNGSDLLYTLISHVKRGGKRVHVKTVVKTKLHTKGCSEAYFCSSCSSLEQKCNFILL